MPVRKSCNNNAGRLGFATKRACSKHKKATMPIRKSCDKAVHHHHHRRHHHRHHHHHHHRLGFATKCACSKHKKASAKLSAAKMHTKRQARIKDRIRRKTIMGLPPPLSETRVALVHGAKELVWLSLHLQLNPETVVYFYEHLCRGIFTVPIPGNPRGHTGRPTKAMLEQAIKNVIKFYDKEEALGKRSAVYQAFMIASAEKELSFDWDVARRRVSSAKFDVKKEVDKWEDCLAMSHGDSQGEVEIAVCGTKPMTVSALTALLCHEGLHNFAKRTRPGQAFLSAEIEHVAMALMGDPQL